MHYAPDGCCCCRCFRSFLFHIFCFCLSPQGMFDCSLWAIWSWCYIEGYCTCICSFFDQNFCHNFCHFLQQRKIKKTMFLIWLDNSWTEFRESCIYTSRIKHLLSQCNHIEWLVTSHNFKLENRSNLQSFKSFKNLISGCQMSSILKSAVNSHNAIDVLQIQFIHTVYGYILKSEILIFFSQISINSSVVDQLTWPWLRMSDCPRQASSFKFKRSNVQASKLQISKQTFPLKISRPHQCFLPVSVLYGRFPQWAGDATFQSNLHRLWSRILSFECIQPPHEKLSPEEEKNGRRNRDSARALQKEKTTSSPSYSRWPPWKDCK